MILQQSIDTSYSMDYLIKNKYYVPRQGQLICNRYNDLGYILGKGSFSTVIKAYDTRRYHSVAIKISRFTDSCCDSTQALKDEINILKELNTQEIPGILNILDIFVWNNRHCIVMRHIENNLQHFISTQKINSVIMLQILRKLFITSAELTKLNIIHCDIKPSNILIDRDYTPYIIDFGIAKKIQDPVESYTQTRWYRAPEVILNIINSNTSDIWSIGCIIYELLTGKVLFDAKGDENNKYSTYQLSKIESILGSNDNIYLNKQSDTSLVSYYYNKINDEYILKKRYYVDLSLIKLTTMYSRFDKDFTHNILSLLMKCFEYDHTKRITAQEAINIIDNICI